MTGGPHVAETHISYVLFAGDHAFKLKKPVRFEFIDLTRREDRERICHREVELNRRLAPDVYLGVLDVTDEEGRPTDHLVHMRRMPSDRRLSDLVERDPEGAAACLRGVAHAMAAFHAGAETSEEIARHGSWEAVRRRWSLDLDEVSRFSGEVLDGQTLGSVTSLARSYLAGRKPLFEKRVAEGHIRDGHGDLQAGDIFCLDDGPRILDCIEFSDELRYTDVLADVAFLAMDLERLGAPEAARGFLALYREFSGQTYPESLAHLHIAQRALVRSKVSCLRHHQDGDEESKDQARSLLDLTSSHLARGRVRLVLIGGSPGTGKSTTAASLARKTGWTLLRSDEVRKEIAGLAHDAKAPAGFHEGIYTPEMTERTYRSMLDRAKTLLELGETTILDASWSEDPRRRAAAEVAGQTHSQLIEMRCVLDPSEATARIRQRLAHGTDASDADAAVAEAVQARFDPWPRAAEVSTAGTTERSLEQALAAAGPY